MKGYQTSPLGKDADEALAGSTPRLRHAGTSAFTRIMALSAQIWPVGASAREAHALLCISASPGLAMTSCRARTGRTTELPAISGLAWADCSQLFHPEGFSEDWPVFLGLHNGWLA